MVMVKKSATGGGAPSLDILAAKLRIVEAELSLEEKEIKLDNGRSFTAEPNLNVKVEVLANLVDPGADEGVKFYDRFKLKKDDDGEWAFLKYSKLGNLIVVRYGDEWFDNPNTEFEESDFEGFEFVAHGRAEDRLEGQAAHWIYYQLEEHSSGRRSRGKGDQGEGRRSRSRRGRRLRGHPLLERRKAERAGRSRPSST